MRHRGLEERRGQMMLGEAERCWMRERKGDNGTAEGGGEVWGSLREWRVKKKGCIDGEKGELWMDRLTFGLTSSSKSPLKALRF